MKYGWLHPAVSANSSRIVWLYISRADIQSIGATDRNGSVGATQLTNKCVHCQRLLFSGIGCIFCSQIMWVLGDVCRLFAKNVGSFAINSGRRGRIFSNNSGRKSGCLQVLRIMFAGRYTYLSVIATLDHMLRDANWAYPG
jgi:hypothetical protein